MNWVSQAFAALRDIEREAPAKKSYTPWFNSYSGQTGTSALTATGLFITEQNALQTVAVYACVRALAETLASLPMQIIERDPDGGCSPAEGHPLEDLVCCAPNTIMTPYTMVETVQGHAGLRGNGFAWIEKDKRGKPIGLWPLRSDRVSYVPGEDDNGRPLPTWFYATQFGRVIEIWPRDVIHIKGLGGDGIMAYSPIQLHRQAVALSKATEESGARFFGNSARPAGVFKHPQQLTPEAYDRIRASIDADNSGVGMTGKTLILEEGMDWAQIGLSNEDAQYLETRGFQTQEIARMWRVPPHLIGAPTGDRQTYANIEQRSLEFLQYTLLPWITRWEQELNRKLMPPADRGRFAIRFDVDVILRADLTTRYNAWKTGIDAGFLMRNEARNREQLEDIDGLDDPKESSPGAVQQAPMSPQPAMDAEDTGDE